MPSELQLFIGPLQARLRLRFRSKSVWDEFLPYRTLRELIEYTRGLNPDDLVYAVAEGADKFSSSFRVRNGSLTQQAFERLIDQSKIRADRLRPVWKAHLAYIESTEARARSHAMVETIKFVSKGDLTIGAALQESFLKLFDFESVDKAAREASTFGKALDVFADGVFDDFANLVLPALRRDSERGALG